MKLSSLLPSTILVTDIWEIKIKLITFQNVQNPKHGNKRATGVELDHVLTVNNLIKASVLFNRVFRILFCRAVRLNDYTYKYVCFIWTTSTYILSVVTFDRCTFRYPIRVVRFRNSWYYLDVCSFCCSNLKRFSILLLPSVTSVSGNGIDPPEFSF